MRALSLTTRIINPAVTVLGGLGTPLSKTVAAHRIFPEMCSDIAPLNRRTVTAEVLFFHICTRGGQRRRWRIRRSPRCGRDDRNGRSLKGLGLRLRGRCARIGAVVEGAASQGQRGHQGAYQHAPTMRQSAYKISS